MVTTTGDVEQEGETPRPLVRGRFPVARRPVLVRRPTTTATATPSEDVHEEDERKKSDDEESSAGIVEEQKAVARGRPSNPNAHFVQQLRQNQRKLISVLKDKAVTDVSDLHELESKNDAEEERFEKEDADVDDGRADAPFRGRVRIPVSVILTSKFNWGSFIFVQKQQTMDTKKVLRSFGKANQYMLTTALKNYWFLLS